MKITIYDVAKKAGVSISTASKALNDRKDVGDKTKEAVRIIAKELNYEPSRFARALAMRKTENIGVVSGRFYRAPVITNPFYSKILEGIEEVLADTDFNLVTNVVKKEQIEAMELPKIIKEKSVDGLILLGHMPADYAEMIIDKGIPVVMIDNSYDTDKADCIVADNEGGAFNAVEQLIKLGHKKIAYMSRNGRYSFLLRRDGYKRALIANGLPVDDNMIVFCRENQEEADDPYAWMKKVIEGDNKPDALFMCNDINAILAINMLKDAGLKVPDDMSVVGFDNIELAGHFIPSIATVNVPKEEMGKKAVNILLDIMNKKRTAKEKIVVPTEFIMGGSVRNR